jgi:hypothetical protein
MLHLPALVPQGANYLRLVALLVGGGGMVYSRFHPSNSDQTSTIR